MAAKTFGETRAVALSDGGIRAELLTSREVADDAKK